MRRKQRSIQEGTHLRRAGSKQGVSRHVWGLSFMQCKQGKASHHEMMFEAFCFWEVMTLTDQFERTRLLIGDRGLAVLQESSVIVFGVGGVGSFAVEALARAGVGK